MPDIYQDLNQLLTCLYTAPGEAQNWQRFLSTFADLTDSAQSLMFFHDERQQRTHINCGHNLDDAFEPKQSRQSRLGENFEAIETVTIRRKL